MTWTFWNCQVIRDYYSSHWASSTCLNRSINCVLQYFTKFTIVNFLLHYFFMYLYTSIFVQFQHLWPFCFILYFIKNRKCFFSLADFFYLIVGMDHEQYNCSLWIVYSESELKEKRENIWAGLQDNSLLHGLGLKFWRLFSIYCHVRGLSMPFNLTTQTFPLSDPQMKISMN